MRLQRELMADTDWRTMIVMDACRYDTLADIAPGFMEPPECVDSQAHCTIRWYRRHWDSDYKDTVLITAHPIIGCTFVKTTCHFAAKIWIEKETPAESIDWILPENTLKCMPDIIKQYPDKKYLIHLVPPHLPFIGKSGIVFQKQELGWGITGAAMYKAAMAYAKRNGWNKLREYYRENIQVSLAAIQKYLGVLKGPIIITADHGELLGEDNRYGHQGKHPQLQEVPWAQVI